MTYVSPRKESVSSVHFRSSLPPPLLYLVLTSILANDLLYWTLQSIACNILNCYLFDYTFYTFSMNTSMISDLPCISRSCHEVTRYHVVNLVPHGKETFWRLEITSLSRHSSHKEKSLWYPRCESSSTRNVEIIWWEILVVAREFLFINSTKKLKG